METPMPQPEKKPKKPRKNPKPTVKKDGTTIRIMLDEEGNRIIATDKGNILSIDLKLKSEKRRRHIGQVTKSTRTLFLTRKRCGGHLHELSNSYGFNYKIIEMARSFDVICVQDEQQRWKFLREDVLAKENQNFLFFKQQGFELQTFLSLDKMDELTKKFALMNNRESIEPVF